MNNWWEQGRGSCCGGACGPDGWMARGFKSLEDMLDNGYGGRGVRGVSMVSWVGRLQ